MKNILFITTIIIFLASKVSAYDFKNTIWGMTQQEVIDSEADSPSEKKENSLLYINTEDGTICGTRFEFTQNMLYAASKIYIKGDISLNVPYNIYETEKKKMISELGEPNITSESINSTYSDKKDLYSFCVKKGKCDFLIQWEKQRSGAQISLKNNETDDAIVFIIYWDISKSLDFKRLITSNSLPDTKSEQKKSPWIFPDSSSRYLTNYDIISLTKDQIWIAKNEIYARNGYIFDTKKGKIYAERLGPYYTPRSRNIKFNKYEEYNIMLLLKYF